MKLRTWVFALVVLGLAVAAGLIWRNHVIHSPEHSLKRLASAIEQHDVATFQELVDIDTVVNRYFDASMAAVLKDTTDADLATMIGQGMAALMKPRLATEAKAAIIAAVEKGLPEDASGGLVFGSYIKRTGIAPENFQRLSAVARDGATALVSLEFSNTRIDSTVTLELRMRDMGDYWQVSEIANSVEFEANLEAAEKRRLESFNRPIRERLATTLIVEDLRKTAKDIDSFFGGEVSLRASIRNVSDTTIAGFSIHLQLANTEGHNLIDLPISSSDPLAPRSTYAFSWKQGLGLFAGSEERAVARTPPDDIRTEIVCERLQLPDGTIVELFATLDEALAARAAVAGR
jgi:hypothetical protein